MKNIRLLVAAGLVALSFGGCAAIQQASDTVGGAYSAITGATVSREAVVLARTSFNAAEVTATNYLSVRRCTGSNGPVCRDPAVRKQIVAAVLAGRGARNELTAFMRAHPNELGPKGVYDVLTSSTKTIQDLVATYKTNR